MVWMCVFIGHLNARATVALIVSCSQSSVSHLRAISGPTSSASGYYLGSAGSVGSPSLQIVSREFRSRSAEQLSNCESLASLPVPSPHFPQRLLSHSPILHGLGSHSWIVMVPEGFHFH